MYKDILSNAGAGDACSDATEDLAEQLKDLEDQRSE